MIVVLDACIIMYWVEGDEPYYSRLVQCIRQLEQVYPNCGYAVSRMSVLECLVKPVRDNDTMVLHRYGKFFASRNLQVIEMTPNLIDSAIRIRALHGLKVPDAIQVATALSIKQPACFLTNDKRLGSVLGLTICLLPE